MPAINGLVVMTPTSVASTGTGNSSSINADGSVDFASCATLSLNGVFTSSYDNYMISIRHQSSSGGGWVGAKMRSSGTDNSSNLYYTERIFADGSSVTATGEGPSTSWLRIFYANDAQRSGSTIYVFTPKVAQKTIFRSVTGSGYLNATVSDSVGLHFFDTSYDGISIIPSGVTLSGLLTVFGFNK